MKSYKQFALYFILLCFSCKSRYIPTQQHDQLYKIESSIVRDTSSMIEKYLRPYRDSLDKNMQVVIGEASDNFIKERPGGSLGQLVIDAMQDKLKSTKTATEGVIYNYGGLRMNQIAKGNITVGKIYELLPFDNELVIVAVKGSILNQWLKHAEKEGGWPMSSFKDTLYVENPVTTEQTITVSNRTWASDSMYYIATNDYVANGGDKCDFLIPCKKIQTGITIRDILIAYIKKEKMLYPHKL